jgi:protein-L-isoaspartate(D-aspartate) O-methyltransferase
MTQLLDLPPGGKVLEIGTGSGYQAAVLAAITDHVYTIEIIKELGERTEKLFKEIGYDKIKVKKDDGYYGWKEHAPFDGIIVTAAAGHIPPPLIQQLKPGGRIIIPIGGPYEVQYLTLVGITLEGELYIKQLLPVRFVPMTGKVQNE